MFANIKLLAAIALLHCVCQPTARANIHAVFHPSNDVQGILQPSGEIVTEMVTQIYDNNFDNFYKVIEFANYSSSPNFKGDVLLALYDVMRAAHHTDDPLRALPLYDEIEELINQSSNYLSPAKLNELESVRSTLLWLTIVPVGAEILNSAVYLSTCQHDGTVVGKLMNLLDASNRTVSDLTITRMVETVRWTLPMAEQVPIMSKLSIHVHQNVDALLALYNQEQFEGDLQMSFLIHLGQLRRNPAYKTSVLAEKQRQVDAIVPASVQILLDGTACLHQKMSNSSIFYLQECRSSLRVCTYIAEQATDKTVFNVEVNSQAQAFNFFSKRYDNRPLSILPDRPLEPWGYKFNVYSTEITTREIDWKLHADGNQIIVQNMNSTMFLCAGSLRAVQNGNEWYAYTRDPESYSQHSDECKWNVENCKDVS